MLLDGLKIGLIEDDPIMGESLVQGLGLEGGDVIWWESGSEALCDLPFANRDIVICDIRLPDLSGETVFTEASRYRGAAPFLFMTAFGEIDEAVRLLKNGAGDYVTKPFELEEMFKRITALVSTAEWAPSTGALGPSVAMLEIERMLKQVSATQIPVLLVGETGVGKEVCARFLHELGAEDSAPFIAVNCAAIPENIMEIELFGTELPELHRGYAERAQKGVLFLDGIAELSLNLQPKLLRLLEDETFFRLGGASPIHFEARVICSLNKNPKDLLRSNLFREDLYYRINTVSVEIPPLRQRTEDVIWLAERFLIESAALGDTEPRALSASAEESLTEHQWPGNARELRNRIERANALCLTRYIMPENLFPDWSSDPDMNYKIAKLSEVRDAAEKRQIELALKAKNGNLSRAARALGIARTTMWEKMLKHEIKSRLEQ